MLIRDHDFFVICYELLNMSFDIIMFHSLLFADHEQRFARYRG